MLLPKGGNEAIVMCYKLEGHTCKHRIILSVSYTGTGLPNEI